MQKLRTVWHEVVGLFVDDQLFALAILVWLALVWLIVKHSGIAPVWDAVTLFAGLAVLLVETTSRAARR